jgi:hypothetical protein
MRTVLLSAMLWLAAVLAAPAAGPVFEDARKLVEYAYAPYLEGGIPEDITELFSPTLMQLWDQAAARAEEGPVLGFDPYINAQDFELSDLVIADPAISGDQAEVAVSFSNFGEPQELHFFLVRRAEGWKIDDIEATGEPAWRLSELLAADPMLN